MGASSRLSGGLDPETGTSGSDLLNVDGRLQLTDPSKPMPSGGVL